MPCNKQKIIEKATKIYYNDFTDSQRVGKTHVELMSQARENAISFIEAEMKAREVDFAEQADEQASLTGAVQELNAANPMRGNTKLTITDVNNGIVYAKFPDGKKEYPLDPREITLDQKSAVGVIAKYDNAVTLGSSTNADFNTDGTSSKVEGLNEKLIEVDKENRGDKFDAEQSTHLTEFINKAAKYIDGFNDISIRLDDRTEFAEREDVAGQGKYHFISVGKSKIELVIDKAGPGQEYRNQFSMSNQETYAHELAHALTQYLLDGGTEVANNPKVQSLIGDIKSLYNRGRENTTWEDLLPGDATKYSTFEQAQAKKKWDYIFKNSNPEAGIHEFVAALMTNKQFSTAMDGVTAFDSKKNEGKGFLDKVLNALYDFFDNIVGFATGRKNTTSKDGETKNTTISDEGTRLVFEMVKAHKKASDTVDSKITHTMDKVESKIADGIEVINDAGKKIIEPFVGFIDVLDEVIENKVLSEAEVKEAIKLQEELNKIIKPMQKSTSNYRLVVIVENLLKAGVAIINFLRAVPKAYKLRKLAAGSKESQKVMDMYDKVFNRALESMNLTADGVIRKLVRNFIDKPGIYNWVADSILRLTENVDKVRELRYERILSDSNEWFGDVAINEDKVNIRNNEALTSVVLRTDIQSLGVDAKGLLELLRDPSKVSKKIHKLKAQFNDTQILDAESLANYLVTGVGTASNAENIVKGFGTKDVATEVNEYAIEDMDELISLMALEKTNPSQKETLKNFLEGKDYVDYSNTIKESIKKVVGFTGNKPLTEAEYKAKVLEGTNKFIESARGLNAESIEEMAAAPHKRIKGYVKETYEERRTVEIHKMSDKAQLEKDGYVFVKELVELEGENTAYGMFITLDEDVKRANGALGLQDMKARGTTLGDIVMRNGAEEGGWDSAKRKAEFKKLLEVTKRKYARNRKSINMSPVYNSAGNIVDFRATLSLQDKIEHLGLETRGTQNLARSRAQMGNARRTAAHNEEVLNELHKDYNENYKKNPDKYIVIEPKTLDAEAYDLESTADDKKATEYERMWARLPKATKAKARELWGSNQIIVNKELLTITFGEDNWSIADAKMLEKTSPRFRAVARKIENYWIDIMQLAKSNIVLKTPEVLIDNIWSNAKILVYIGMNPKKAIKLLILGAKELKRYETDRKELMELEFDYANRSDEIAKTLKPFKDAVAAAKGQPKAVKDKAEIALEKAEHKIYWRKNELVKELHNNTVAPLLEAGLYQSIVEDVNTLEESNRVSDYFSQLGDKAPKSVNTIMQYLFLSHKTPPYKFMMKATQMSDFLFRYAQYYDAIEKGKRAYVKKNYGVTRDFEKHYGDVPTAEIEKIEKKAKRETIDNYINYEVPLDRATRYVDSMSPQFFKYFVRIQKVIKRFVKDHPARVGMDIGVQSFITDDTPDVLDMSVLDKGLINYNPISTGFDMVRSLKEVIYPQSVQLAVQAL